VAYTTTAPVRASGTLTFETIATNADTITIGAKTYNMRASLTDVNGYVFIGTTVAIAIQNLYDAINLSGTTTQYAASMTAHPSVKATAKTATTLVVTAHAPGTIGNGIATTDTLAGTSAWGAATLAGGVGELDPFVVSLMANSQVNAELITDLKLLTIAAD